MSYEDPYPAEEPKSDEKPATFCPATKISDNMYCFRCHVEPDFKLKESKPGNNLQMPYGARLVDGKPYLIVDVINSTYMQEFFEYLYWHPQYDHVVIEIHSPGGSLLDAWKIIGMMDEARRRGVVIETRCYGFAASAGFLVFVNGDIGARLVNPMAMTMWHELWSIAWLKIETPSKKEEEAEIMRYMQDTIHNWLITRCTKELTKEELDGWVKFKDKWFNGADLIDIGFADGVPK